MQNINDLFKRYSALENEVSYIARKQKEEAVKAEEILKRISREDIDLLKEVVPAVEVISKFTANDLLDNGNNEVELVQSVYNQLTDVLDKWLKEYEDRLC